MRGYGGALEVPVQEQEDLRELPLTDPVRPTRLDLVLRMEHILERAKLAKAKGELNDNEHFPFEFKVSIPGGWDKLREIWSEIRQFYAECVEMVTQAGDGSTALVVGYVR